MDVSGCTVEVSGLLEGGKWASHPSINPHRLPNTFKLAMQPRKCTAPAKFISTGPTSLFCAPIHSPKLSPFLLQAPRLSLPFCWSFNFISASTFIKECTISSSHPSCVISNEQTSIQCPVRVWFYLMRAAAGWRTESTLLRVQKPEHRISHINHSVTSPSRTSASLPLKQ